jgi:putative DNA primase/helicase
MKKQDKQGTDMLFPLAEPWPELVDGTELARNLVDELRRYVVVRDGAETAIMLWVFHTYVHSASMISPILAITSPERRCGKTTLVSILAELVSKPLVASNLTTSVLFRVVDKYAPTIFIDEADTFLRQNREMAGILNSGQNRAAAYVLRNTGDDYEPRKFSTWAPKAIALIKDLPATLEDRSILVQMRRRLPHEPIEKFRLDRVERFVDFRRKLVRWAADNEGIVAQVDPELPTSLNDRAADNWRPLMAIAEILGDDFPKLASAAALQLAVSSEPEESHEHLLLGDIRKIFREIRQTRIATEELVERLNTIEESPWGGYLEGRGINPRIVAKKLKIYRVRPGPVWIGSSSGKAKRGYHLSDFADAFDRYLPPLKPDIVIDSNDTEGRDAA